MTTTPTHFSGRSEHSQNERSSKKSSRVENPELFKNLLKTEAISEEREKESFFDMLAKKEAELKQKQSAEEPIVKDEDLEPAGELPLYALLSLRQIMEDEQNDSAQALKKDDKLKNENLQFTQQIFQHLENQTAFTLETSLNRTEIASLQAIHTEVATLFDQAVDHMVFLSSSEMKQTTVTLNTAPDSLFSGAKIVIQEFSSAPRQYNIKLIASPEAVSVFQKHVGELIASFRTKNFDFDIHRFETDFLKSEKEPFKRKEDISREKENR